MSTFTGEARTGACTHNRTDYVTGTFNLRGLLATLVAALALSGCGGGGGGGGGGNTGSGGSSGGGSTPPPSGSVELTVVDEFDTPVAGADISVSVDTETRNGSTDGNGVATVSSVPPGSAEVTVTATGFEQGALNITVSANSQTTDTLTLTRETEPAAGLFSAQLTQSLPDTDGQTLTVGIELLVVDDDPTTRAAIETLTAADFTLLACTDSDPNVAECLEATPVSDDIGYTVISASAENFELVPGQAPAPYAASLLIDQSGSTTGSDPSDARLFATKVFIGNLGPNDFVSVAAFAENTPSSTAEIPETPVFRLSPFVQSDAGRALFPDIDMLASQESGGTPLYGALDSELEFTAASAPSDSSQRKAVVLFTDGDDSICLFGTVPPCGLDVSIQKSRDLGVDIFTVGLGSEVDIEVLQRLAEAGGGFFLFAENARQLFPIYQTLGELLSRSLPTYRMEWTIRADEPNAYSEGDTVLGILRIDTGRNQIDLPIRIFLLADSG
ncbi:MAG: carboxypeptidase regulatory-like domain-containing protein [Pseudomonadota bacterium]